MAESIATYRKPGFPKLDTTENSFRTVIEYIGPVATISAAQPNTGTTWGTFNGVVRSTAYALAEGSTTQAEMTVTVEMTAENSDEPGELESETYEIEWVMVERSMYEHPAFALDGDGAFALSAGDVEDLELWKNEKKAAKKKAYKYSQLGSQDVELSDNARLFAKGIQLGLETFEDYAPVARKTSTYTGGPPDESLAGQKDDPVGFTRLPTGYEWRKSADRNVTAGKRTRWERVEEWLGAKKVLYDKDQIFWSAP